jgi:hypothetical protein
MALGGALLLALACSPAPAVAASRAAVSNGTYNAVTSGSASAPGQPAYVFTATVRDNVIASSRLWQQSWNGGLSFDAFPTKVKVPSGTWSGTSSGTQPVDSDGPHGPVSGAVGAITLQVSGGAITGGTGSFAPVDPTSGVPTGGPAVSVTYGAGGFRRTSGFFSLPSTPAGYDLCGAVGAGNSGSILGLVACQQSPYLPSSFALGED